jgi:beta-glucanase (GH16 family)
MNLKKSYYNLTSILLAAVSICFIGCDISEPEPIQDKVPSDSYVLVWSDEFDQDSQSPNPDYWNYETGYGSWGWGNDEWQLYTSSQENIRTEDGKMVISALCPSGVPGKRDGSVTSARVTTKNKFDIKYGKIEARIKLPGGMGTWPAFWMLGKNIDDVSWPGCGEIDIMEASPYLLGRNTTSCAIHWDDGGHNYVSDKLELGTPLNEDYHVYEVEWSQERIVGRIDGMTYFVKAIDPNKMSEFYNKFFLILNVAIGGNMGGTPDATTVWPQRMYIDYVRAYQIESDPIETFGLFTDETPVDDRITPGLNAEIYVWEETLTGASIPPYEGSNVLSFATTGKGWFGGGIMSNYPIDMSAFQNGYINFMIKIPAEVTFKIGLIDALGGENYVEFPANETVFGLERNGEWGQARIPVSEIMGTLDLEMLSYEFVFLEERGTQCEFAIDDIYWSGGGRPATSVSFRSELYSVESSSAEIKVSDTGAANTTVSVNVSNGTESINVDVTLDPMGNGNGTFYFGTTDDATNTISISEGSVLSLTYIDFYGVTKTSSITIIIINDYFGIFTDLSPVGAGLTIGVDSQIIDTWFGVTMQEGSVAPFEGENVLTFKTPASGSWGAGIMSDSAKDFSGYSSGKMNFMIKIPGDVSFKIAIINSSYQQWIIDFPANETKYGLVRNGEWGRVSIPLQDFGSTGLSSLKYEFFIQGQSGGNWEFAVDDIYYNK